MARHEHADPSGVGSRRANRVRRGIRLVAADCVMKQTRQEQLKEVREFKKQRAAEDARQRKAHTDLQEHSRRHPELCGVRKGGSVPSRRQDLGRRMK